MGDRTTSTGAPGRAADLPVCPNCGQWQHPPYGDCLNECKRRGFALEHPCGHCGLHEGAGAAGLCMECNDLADAQGENGPVGAATWDGDDPQPCEACGRVFVHDEECRFFDNRSSEEELYHERAHAGVSDPDTCDRGAGCPRPRHRCPALRGQEGLVGEKDCACGACEARS